MATTIGTFTNRDGKITGKIRTLTLDAALTFLPNENPTSAEAPAYRIFGANKMEPRGRRQPKPRAGNTFRSL